MQLFHSSDRRKGRGSEPGQAYLVTTATENREPLFSDWRIGRICVRELRVLHQFGVATSLAWVLMPDHLHWLLTVHYTPLDYVMKRLKARSALMINRTLGRKGPVWQRGFRDHPVRQEQDLAGIGRYIVANPLRAGLVTQIGDYPLWDAAWLSAEG
jgi:REP element-mobilizing transposase RayT